MPRMARWQGPSPLPDYHVERINQPCAKRMPWTHGRRLKAKPRRSGCQTGASSLGTWLRGINPYRVILSKLRGLQRVLLTTTAMQNRRAKTRSPERGLVSRGHAGSMNSGIIVWDVSTTRCVNKGDNSRILARCDIGATEKGGKTWSADRSRCLSRPCR